MSNGILSLKRMNTIFLRSFLFFQHIKVIPCSQNQPEKVIILAPHPDDETVSCGGALQAHLEHGDQVSIIVLTDGSASSKQIEDLVKIRENEVKKAVGGIF